jgi:2-amino-4-hydroxy-6-hydroxymethyldihydropteridine diphosphokinase
MCRLQDYAAAPIRKSSLWKSAPIDCPPGSPWFVNAVVALLPQIGTTPETFLGQLQDLEKAFGRQPKCIVNEPRFLDLDLVAFGREIRNGPDLIVPHPRAHLRRFVLEPLCEIAPDYLLPNQSDPVKTLRSRLRSSQSLGSAQRYLPVLHGHLVRIDLPD